MYVYFVNASLIGKTRTKQKPKNEKQNQIGDCNNLILLSFLSLLVSLTAKNSRKINICMTSLTELNTITISFFFCSLKHDNF